MQVSYLVPKLASLLDAPFPFFIGVSPSVWNGIANKKVDDIIVYNADKQGFISEVKFPVLPEPMSTILIKTINTLLKSKEKFMNVPNTTHSKIV